MALALAFVATALLLPVAAPVRGATMPVRILGSRAVDTDGNGKYERLDVAVSINESGGRSYELQAGIVAPVGTWPVTSTLDVGPEVRQVNVSLPGPLIYLSGQDGAYQVYVTVYWVDASTYPPGLLGNLFHFTAPYNHTSFEPPWASIAGPIVDQPWDPDGDGLLDALLVRVPLSVTKRGPVLVEAEISQAAWGSVAAVEGEDQDSHMFDPGSATWTLTFAGTTIRGWGTFDGPFTVGVGLTLPGVGLVNATSGITAIYQSTQFVGPPAEITGIPTWEPVDTDGNGLYDYAALHVPVHVREARDYILYGGIDGYTVDRLFTLPAGNLILNVTLDSATITRRGGFYPTNDLLIDVTRDRDSGTDFRITWPWEPIGRASFENPAVENLSVFVSDARPCVNVVVDDPATGYTAYASGAPGRAIALYNGTFDVIAFSCAQDAGVATGRVAVQGNTSVILTLPPATPVQAELGLEVPSWDTVDANLTLDMRDLSPFLRLDADQRGNRNGAAEADEVARYVEFNEALDPVEAEVDTKDLLREPFEVFAAKPAQDIVASEPLVLHVAYPFRNSDPPAQGSLHRLRLDVSYADRVFGWFWSDTLSSFFEWVPEVTLSGWVRIMTGATGNLTLASEIPWAEGGNGFLLPANATAVRTGVGSWDLVVGNTPPMNGFTLARLRIMVDAVGGAPGPEQPGASSDLVLLGIATVAVAASAIAVFFWRRGRRGVHGP